MAETRNQLPNGDRRLSSLGDEELIALGKDKNFAAFDELVRRYEGRIYHLGLKILKSPQDAEDLLQKTFLSIFENLATFRGKSSVSTWIFRIATNHALMKLRREKKIRMESLDVPMGDGPDVFPREIEDFTFDASRVYENTELKEILHSAIRDLPEIYRLVFVLRDIEGFSNEEASRILGITTPAVKSRLLRSRLALRDTLKKYFAVPTKEKKVLKRR